MFAINRVNMPLGAATVVAFGLFALNEGGWAQDAARDAIPIEPASRLQQLRIGKSIIPYRITWSSLTLQDDAGAPAATISATSYVRTDRKPSVERPVMFAFNGGPGASSTPLHFTLLGPCRRTDEKSDGNLGLRPWVDNTESLVDVADLVMVDPVGTGFSRELAAGAGRRFWNVAGDAEAMLIFIRDWLRKNGRTASPLIIVGESYGGTRVAQMARDLADLNVAGVILVSPALDMGATEGAGNDQPFIFNLPTMAITALFHQKIELRDRTPEQLWHEARVFAQGEYASALQLGSTIPADERDRIAHRMAELIGLPPELIARSNLRVDSQFFLNSLVPGKVVGRIDTRIAAPRPEKPADPSRPAAADDPALGMIGQSIKKSEFAKDYLKSQAGLDTNRDYYALRLDLAMSWDWFGSVPKNMPTEDVLSFRAYYNLTPNLAVLMNKRPAAKMLLIGGYYDLATPLLAPQYALAHSGIPLDRLTVLSLLSGHTAYAADDARKLVSKAIHAFVASTL